MSPTKLLNDHADRNMKFLSIEKKLAKLGHLNATTRNDVAKLNVSNSMPSESFAEYVY